VEEIAAELARWLAAHGIKEISGIYGCSMGGAIVTRFLADQRIRVRAAVIDGGITPYQLPWIATRCIAVRDFLMICMGKFGGVKLLEKAFNADDYSDEDLQYIAKVLRFVSAKTVWRTFDSCNNYAMPKDIRTDCVKLEYWYAQTEKKARKWDIAYIRKSFPQAVFREFENVGHGGLAALKPELLVSELERAMGGKGER
jgi:pimeloyl-ACP methyl ester carboxylesterase